MTFYMQARSPSPPPKSASRGNLNFGPSSSIDNWEEADEISQSFVDDLMRSWQKRYCKFTDLKLFVGTYNVNNQAPPESLRPWLADRFNEPPDIYVLGFQELDLSQYAFLYATDFSTTREQKWVEVVYRSLHKSGDYLEVKRIRLVGILMIVFALRKHKAKIKHESIYAQYLPTGLWNRIGNKGGVGVSMLIEDTRVCFINSHLAAGSDEVLRRNQDFREISRIFPHPIKIVDHDAAVWLGDLNYRLENEDGKNLDNLTVRTIVNGQNFAQLLKQDQLSRMRQKNSAFHEYTEGAIRFLPTYKYDPGTDSWDSSEKARVPAWCDRVLWLAKTDELKQKLYDSVNEVRISDHKPVLSLFDLKIKTIQPEKYKAVMQEANKEADRLANEALPQVDLHPHDQIFDFGEVKFLEPKVLTLTIKNVGKYPVKFVFCKGPQRVGGQTSSSLVTPRSKSVNDSIFPPWLIVMPDSAKIDVGKECIVDFQILVDKMSAWELNSRNSTSLSDVLILKLRRGRDYFLSINGNYVRSCFGQSLENLMQMQEPIQNEQLLIDLSPHTSSVSKLSLENLPAPKELYRLVEHIRNGYLHSFGQFSEGPSHADFAKIRDCLDCGYPEQLPDVEHSFSLMEALFRFLDSLPEPVVPVNMQNQCLRVAHASQACWQAVEQFPEAHKKTFNYLMEFAREIVANTRSTDLTSSEICETFSDLFFRKDTPQNASERQGRSTSDSSELKRKAVQFIESCLVYYKDTALEF